MSFEKISAKNFTKQSIFFLDEKWFKRSEQLVREYSRFFGCIFQIKDLHYMIERSAKFPVLKYAEVSCLSTSIEEKKLELAAEYLNREHMNSCGNRCSVYRMDELKFVENGLIKLSPATCHKCGKYLLCVKRSDTKHSVCYKCYLNDDYMFPFHYGYVGGWCCKMEKSECGSGLQNREEELEMESPEDALLLAESAYKQKSRSKEWRTRGA